MARHTPSRKALAARAALRFAAAVPIPPNRGPEKLLRVKTEFFTATAVWQKIFGAWSCTKAAPQLAWMEGISADAAALALIRMGADFEFSSVESVNQTAPKSQPADRITAPKSERSGNLKGPRTLGTPMPHQPTPRDARTNSPPDKTEAPTESTA